MPPPTPFNNNSRRQRSKAATTTTATTLRSELPLPTITMASRWTAVIVGLVGVDRCSCARRALRRRRPVGATRLLRGTTLRRSARGCRSRRETNPSFIYDFSFSGRHRPTARTLAGLFLPLNTRGSEFVVTLSVPQSVYNSPPRCSCLSLVVHTHTKNQSSSLTHSLASPRALAS